MKLMLFLLVAAASLASADPALGADGSTEDPPSIGVGVEAPPSGGAGSGDGGGGDEGEGGEGVVSPEWQEYFDCLEAAVTSCMSPPYTPGDPAAPVIDPALAAQVALDEATIPLPGPHTSPDGFPQLTGMETWFWLDPDTWVPITARAELPGVWAEVTAMPLSATWTPGDGGAPVVCDGPGRAHPGGHGAETDCGHTYIEVGAYTLTVAVTYGVTWTSSTGAGGAYDPITVSSELPITVEQRQAVID